VTVESLLRLTPPSLFILDSPCAFLSQALSFTYTVWKNRQNPFARLGEVKKEVKEI